MHVKNAQKIILHAATSTPRRTHSHQHRREEASVEVALGQAQVLQKNHRGVFFQKKNISYINNRGQAQVLHKDMMQMIYGEETHGIYFSKTIL